MRTALPIFLMIEKPMLRPALFALPLSLFLVACTAHEKHVIKELEDLPGITCVTSTQDQTTCGPDSLSVTANPQ